MSYDRETMRGYMRRFRAERRAIAIRVLGGKCSLCGSADRLQYDHRDPATKVKALTKMLHASTEKFMAELEKCQLLCFECHLVKTLAEKGQQRRAHGNMAMYKAGCRCPSCRAANAAYTAKYRAAYGRK